MSIHVKICYEEGKEFQDSWLSGIVIEELRRTGRIGNKECAAVKFDDGRVWNCKTHKWEEKKGN